MSHLSIYLDSETETLVRKAAKKNAVSLSKWISAQLKKTVQTEWSDNFKNLAGAIPNMPSLREIRKPYGSDSKRETW